MLADGTSPLTVRERRRDELWFHRKVDAGATCPVSLIIKVSSAHDCLSPPITLHGLRVEMRRSRVQVNTLFKLRREKKMRFESLLFTTTLSQNRHASLRNCHLCCLVEFYLFFHLSWPSPFNISVSFIIYLMLKTNRFAGSLPSACLERIYPWGCRCVCVRACLCMHTICVDVHRYPVLLEISESNKGCLPSPPTAVRGKNSDVMLTFIVYFHHHLFSPLSTS